MPRRAVQALETAKAFASDQLPLASVQKEIESCWHDLDQNAASSSTDNADVCAIRAMICVLREQMHPGSEDFVNLLSFFLELSNRVASRAEQQIVLMKQHFSHCLGSRCTSSGVSPANENLRPIF
jgi:hypothetical protein